MKILEANTKAAYTKCFEAMKELRPHHSPDSFLTAIRQMKKENYHLWYIEDKSKVVSVAGFRFTTTLYDGLIIDFDDFVTIAEARNKGHATLLFNHLLSIAKQRSIKTIHLNSNHKRFDAHRFYLNKKMNIVAHHFRVEL